MPESAATSREVLLVEYQKAQDSAEHHDDLVASVTSLNWVGSAVLMGFVLGGIGGHLSASHKIALLAISLVGILLSAFVWRWARQLRAVKVAKYQRCKEIEAQLGMKQHTSLAYSAGTQTRLYSILMFSFLVAWVVLVAVVLID